MPTLSVPSTIDSKLSPEKRIANLENTVEELISRLSWLTSKLDSKNVKRLDTNETVIKSADGETRINGPVLEMYDKQAVPVLRLKQGYDSVTGDFLYALYNEAGVQAVGIDSDGNAVYSGSITIGSGANVFMANPTSGIWLGAATFAAAPFSVSLAGALLATSATITGSIQAGSTITGSTITGGTLQTAIAGNARIVLASDSFACYNSANQKRGLFFDITDTGISDILLYHNGTALAEIYDDITGYLIRGLAGATFFGLGGVACPTYCYGTWDFTSATISGLSADSAGLHNHGIPDGTVLAVDGGGTVTFVQSGAHPHTIS